MVLQVDFLIIWNVSVAQCSFHKQGFRLGTKMGLDQAILGARDMEETVEELTDLHKNWVLGMEEEDSWSRGIEGGVGNLWGVHSVKDEGGSVLYRLVRLSRSNLPIFISGQST